MVKVFNFRESVTDAFGFSQYMLQAVENELENQARAANLSEQLKAAVNYAVFPGGKRIRPLLALLLCQDLGGDPTVLVPVVTALEYLHCASLVHDDLPALDNDDMRRGRSSCHKRFGEATAILAGDALVSYAFERLTENSLEASEKLRLVRSLSTAFTALCDGQQLDLSAEREDLKRVYALKTGALFAAAAEFAGIGAHLEQLENCRTLGSNIGIYFQVVDDYIDVHGDEAARGRKESSDVKNNRKTFFHGKEDEAFQAVRTMKAAIEESFNRLADELAEPGATFKSTRFVLAQIEQRLENGVRSPQKR